MQELAMTQKSMEDDKQKELLDNIFHDINTKGDGKIDRDEMFDHLKRTREVDHERKLD